MKIKAGDRVRMTRAFKLRCADSSRDNIKEFGNSIGIVDGPVDFNRVPPEHPDYDKEKIGPEIDVRWLPTKLRYAYAISDLELA